MANDSTYTQLEEHNPDSSCVKCCENSVRLNDLVTKIESLVDSITPEQVQKVSPMAKLIMSMSMSGLNR